MATVNSPTGTDMRAVWSLIEGSLPHSFCSKVNHLSAKNCHRFWSGFESNKKLESKYIQKWSFLWQPQCQNFGRYQRYPHHTNAMFFEWGLHNKWSRKFAPNVVQYAGFPLCAFCTGPPLSLSFKAWYLNQNPGSAEMFKPCSFV